VSVGAFAAAEQEPHRGLDRKHLTLAPIRHEGEDLSATDGEKGAIQPTAGSD
jgi:hypothetical protein